jgi:hypothetical protein
MGTKEKITGNKTKKNKEQKNCGTNFLEKWNKSFGNKEQIVIQWGTKKISQGIGV